MHGIGLFYCADGDGRLPGADRNVQNRRDSYYVTARIPGWDVNGNLHRLEWRGAGRLVQFYRHGQRYGESGHHLSG